MALNLVMSVIQLSMEGGAYSLYLSTFMAMGHASSHRQLSAPKLRMVQRSSLQRLQRARA